MYGVANGQPVVKHYVQFLFGYNGPSDPIEVKSPEDISHVLELCPYNADGFFFCEKVMVTLVNYDEPNPELRRFTIESGLRSQGPSHYIDGQRLGMNALRAIPGTKGVIAGMQEDGDKFVIRGRSGVFYSYQEGAVLVHS